MQDLWKSWKELYKNRCIAHPESICKDGKLDDEKFNVTQPKVLFIMKEVNEYPGGDLRKMLKEGPKYQMWHTVARWAAGILNGFPEYREIDKSSKMREALSRIATINLKKKSGDSYAVWARINAYAHQDRELLLEQIKSISPEIIVACGAFDILIWLLDLDVNSDNPYEKPVKSEINNAWVIPWKHPGRVNNKETYKELKKILEENNVLQNF